MILVWITLAGGFVWVGLRGQADLGTFCVGAVLTAVTAWSLRIAPRGSFSPVRWARGALILAQIGLFFGVELARANVRQLRLVLSPRLRVRSRWVHFTTRLEHPATRAMLGVLISLTPGTVTEELDGNELCVHVLDAEPDEDPLAVIRERFEAPLARLEAP